MPGDEIAGHGPACADLKAGANTSASRTGLETACRIRGHRKGLKGGKQNAIIYEDKKIERTEEGCTQSSRSRGSLRSLKRLFTEHTEKSSKTSRCPQCPNSVISVGKHSLPPLLNEIHE